MKTVGRLLRKARGVLRTLSGRRDALRERARQVLAAPNAARATKIHTLAEAADEVGRLAHELHTLIAAARDARKDDPGVPSVKSRRASAPRTSAKAPPATPVATPTPAAPPAAPQEPTNRG